MRCQFSTHCVVTNETTCFGGIMSGIKFTLFKLIARLAGCAIIILVFGAFASLPLSLSGLRRHAPEGLLHFLRCGYGLL